MSIRLGLLGTNTSHAAVFARIFNGTAGNGAANSAGTGAPADAFADVRVTAVYSSGKPGLAGANHDPEELARQHRVERVVDDPRELVGSVDGVLVVDDFEGGALHAGLARPFLTAGVPTFIDKPMTLQIEAAAALFETAEANGTPLFSSSALRFAPELRAFADAPERLGPLSTITSVGPGDWYNYGIHAVEAALSVAGPGIEWVHQHPSAGRDLTVLGNHDGPRVVVHTLRDASYLFHVVAYGAKGMAQVEVRDFDGFYRAAMAAVVQMIKTGRAPVSPHDTLEILAILAAGRRSAETGAAVALRDILPAGRR